MSNVYPNFALESIEPTLRALDVQETFENFAGEVLNKKYSGMHVFRSGGKDGSIDGYTESVFLECKHTAGSHEAIKAEWSKVEKKLSKYLIPAVLPVGQSQYGPWRDAGLPLKRYVFVCNSSPNLSNRISLTQAMNTFFERLAKLPHLLHLKGVVVELVDWNNILEILTIHPQLGFRWFPASRIRGLTDLESVTAKGYFRKYLTDIPYYSLKTHMGCTRVPTKTAIRTEEVFLTQLEDSVTSGMILKGNGGVGKTRLSLEIAKLARFAHWSTFLVNRTATVQDIQALGVKFERGQRVLLLIDYVETARDFLDLVAVMHETSVQTGVVIKYIACCRPSFYCLIVECGSHILLDLSTGDPDGLWFRSYQRQCVSHILTEARLQITPALIRLCRDVPVLAALVLHVSRIDKQASLQLLLNEQDFTGWLTKRLKLTLATDYAKLGSTLAQVLAMLPCPSSCIELLPGATDLLQRLSTEGWVILTLDVDGTQRWEVLHDVVADQLILYEASLSSFAGWLDWLLKHAAIYECLRPTVNSLQRVSGFPVMQAVNWRRLFTAAAKQYPAAWKEVRDLLLKSSLLPTEDQLEFLQDNAAMFAEVTNERFFQNSVGFYLRELDKKKISQKWRPILKAYLYKIAPFLDTTNFPLCWGLKLFDDTWLRDRTLTWIAAHAEDFRTHHLLTTWVSCGYEVELISDALHVWCNKHKTNPGFTLFARHWLAAGVLPISIQPYVITWLELHRDSRDAQFIYTSWMGANGDFTILKKPIIAWLNIHRQATVAAYVYIALIKSEPRVIDKLVPLLDLWFDKNGNLDEARLLLEASQRYKVAWDSSDRLTNWLFANLESEHTGILFGYWLSLYTPDSVLGQNLLQKITEGEDWFMRPFLHTFTRLNLLDPRLVYVLMAMLLTTRKRGWIYLLVMDTALKLAIIGRNIDMQEKLNKLLPDLILEVPLKNLSGELKFKQYCSLLRVKRRLRRHVVLLYAANEITKETSDNCQAHLDSFAT